MVARRDIPGNQRQYLWYADTDLPVAFGAGGGLVVQEQALTPYRVAVPADGVFVAVVATAPCKLAMLHLFNLANSARYIRLYDRTTAPNPAVDMPRLGPMPILTADQLVMPSGVLAFANGLAIVISAGTDDLDASGIQAGDVTGYLGVR